ncbi:MAG: hypothetical protein AB1473_00585 [Thermodesulfobacteriota bacterium]
MGATELGTLINHSFPADGPIGREEDPLTGPFTDNAIFLQSNFIVYPGINQDGPYLLKLLLATLFMNSHDFPHDFLLQVSRAAMALLTLSSAIASRLGHEKYMDSPDRWRGEIEVPDDELLGLHAEAVVFTPNDLESLFRDKSLDTSALYSFVIEPGSLDDREVPLDENPLISKPLVRVGDAIVVISPGSIVHAIRHFILKSARERGLLESIARRFRETQWRFVKDNMRLLSIEPLICEPPPGSVGPPVEEGLFVIDSDKVAFVQLLADDLKDFRCDQPCGTWDHEDIGKTAQERAEAVVEWLTGAGSSYCRNVLVIYVLASIGRDIVFGISGEAANSRTLVVSAQDIEIITQLRECDYLTLWKFAEADARLRQHCEVLCFDFLDLYAVYKVHQDSFYLSDNPVAPVMIVPVGEARGLRIKAARKADVHFARRFGPADAIVVTRFEDEEAIPIYYPEGGMSRTLDQLVEGYAQPVWIESLDRSHETLAANWSLYAKIANMLSYWLWQIMPSLKAHLSPLGTRPIRIRFSVANPESWAETAIPDDSEDASPPTCRIMTDRRIVFFEMPYEIRRLLHAPDNEGERVMLRDLLRGLGQMLVQHGLSNTLQPEEIQSILDVSAPLGRKKKLVLIQTGTRPSLNPDKLPFFRKLQSHDLEEQLDGIADELESCRVGELIGAQECMRVCRQLVDIYLRRIKNGLGQFDWESLLTVLIGQHEAYWHNRAIDEITIPTNIQCYDNLIPQLQRFISDRVNAEHVAVALRLLIEIVAAELPAGHRRVSTNDLDRLLAMAYHLVNWATLSDNIALGILDYRLSVLASGRIGVEKTGPREIWDPFITAKSAEDVEMAIREFDSRFVVETIGEKETFDTSNFDPAFEAEFGLTLSEIGAFHRSFTSLGFAQRSPVVSVPICELRESVSRDLAWHDDKIETAFDLFTLKPRNKWEQAPPGFSDREDVWPWRYGRRLSYLRRPLIQVPSVEKGAIIFWGPRHVEEALRHLFGLVYTGRYKKQPNSSKKMSDLLDSLEKKASKEFVSAVIEWIDSQTDWTPKREVKIGPREILDAPEDLGDVDVLCLDTGHQRLLSIECKNVNHARNPREIANELEKSILGKKKPEDSWVAKHQKRHEWLEGNCATVQTAFNLKEMPLHVKSLVLTSEEIPSAYVRQMPLPVFSFSLLRREGSQALGEI